MPRKGHLRKRELLPDTRYNSVSIAKFINGIMVDGKRSIAEDVIYRALDLAAERLNAEPLDVYEKALENVKPLVEVKARRVGGATYQVPIEVTPERAQVLAIRWLLQFSRAKKGMAMSERLAREMMDAYKGEGASIKRKEDTHKMAEANRAFAHYRI